jgi:diketogulonate reductase-like aldo/keto reductase
VALAFLVRQRALFTIPKAGHVAHARENAAGGDLVLSFADRRRIGAAFPRGPRRRELPVL